MRSTYISSVDHNSEYPVFESESQLNDSQESLSSTEEMNPNSLVTTIAAAASGGVTGATIGGLLAGKTGATIGAVVGSVAGVAIFGDEEHIAQAKSGIVETANDVSHQVKALAADVRHDGEAHIAQAKSSIMETATSASQRVKALAADVRHSISDEQEESEAMNSVGFILPAKVHRRLGVVLGRQGRLRDAIQEFRESLDLDPNSAVTHYNLGIAFVKRGDTNRGLKHLKQARELCLEQGRLRQAKVVAKTIKHFVHT